MVERSLKIKAWDKENGLMIRLNAIECRKGRLAKENFILLLFTGLFDKDESEIYEGDILLIESRKYLVIWDDYRSGWSLVENVSSKVRIPLLREKARLARKLCNFLESPDSL